MAEHDELAARALPVLERLARLYGEPRVRTIAVRKSTRMSASLARAYLSDERVTVAAQLLGSLHLEEVLVHEVAHIVCHWRHGRVRPHGREWRALMEQAGLRPRVRLDPLDVRLPPRRRRPRRRSLLTAAFLRSLL